MKDRKKREQQADEELHFPFIRYGKVLIFCLLVVLELVIVLNNRQHYIWVVATEIILTTENAVKIWALKSYRAKMVCYTLDTLLLLMLTFFTDGMLISTMYIVILSEFYLQQNKLSSCLTMYLLDLILFLATFAVSGTLKQEKIELDTLLAQSFNDLFLLTMHFLIFNFCTLIYRKNTELNESNEKLQKAYAELREMTALEERQRIAKEIHDTAGHSMTTVIMQTEAAKLLVESDPSEAKRRISAANLQAKHALEELRESVHLLSGIGENGTLRSAIMQILHDTTDGTDIVVRSDVDEIELCDAKSRFLLNTLKEGISNGLRHGGATAFWFELKEKGGKVNFLLSDNGNGLKISDLHEGFGIQGMHNRAESLGGDVWFETEPGEGFEIHLVLPSDEKKEQS